MPSRRLRLVARVMVAVLLLVFVSLAGGVYLLKQHSRELTAHVLETFTAATGLAAEAASVDVVLLPVPSVFIGDIRIRSGDLRLSVAYASLRPSFWQLLRGRVWPAHVQLLRPVLTGRLPLASLTRLPAVDAGASAALALPSLPGSLRLEVQQGQIDVSAADGSRLVLDDLGLDLDAGPHDRLDGEAHWSLLRVAERNAVLLASRHARLEGGGRLSAPQAEGSRLRLRGQLRYGDWLRDLRADLRWKGGDDLWTIDGRLDGALTQSGQPIPFSLEGRVRQAEPGAPRAELEDLRFTLDADSGRLDGTLLLPGSGRPQLRGHLRMQRLSLTQWLGFARDLVPGLQLALDNITLVSADFELDSQGLRVPAISASCSGSRFSGTGGVPRWDKPVVTLELAAQQVDLGLAIPEAVGRRPRQPAFPYAPLTSFDPRPESWDQLAQRERGAAAKEAEPPSATDDLGYDIRLSARRLRYGPLHMQDARVVISPGKPASTGLGRALLDVRATLYDGTLTAQATVGGGPDKPEFDIAAGLKNIRTSALGEHLPALPLRGGRLQADATLRSTGGSIPAFLASLSGKAVVRADNGSLPASALPLEYARLGLTLDLRQGRWKQGRVGLSGAWRLTLDGKKLLADSRLDGTLWLGGSSHVALEDADARLHLTTDRGFPGLPQGIDLKLIGRLTAQASPPRLSLQQADAGALGAHYAGSLTLAGGNGLNLAGSGTLRSDDLARTLSLVRGSAPKLPPALRGLRLHADWEYASRRLALKDLSTRLLETDIRGEASVSFQAAPHIRLALSTPSLDIDVLRRALDPEAAAADARRKEQIRAARAAGRPIPPPARPPAGEPWDLRFLQAFSLDGTLHAAQVRSWKLTLTDVRLPLTLAGGRLDYDLRANLYGALLRNTGHAQFDRGMRVANRLSVSAFDLAQASAARGGEARVTGRASVEVDATAALNGPGQMPAAISGNWKLLVSEGTHQPLDKHGREKGSPTRFSRLSASGDLRQGVARSSDLSLRSADMNVTGGGWINLVEETLDCSLRVDTPTMNNIPVRVYGSLHDAKTSISAGTVLLYALSGIAQGITGLVGGLLDGALGLFR